MEISSNTTRDERPPQNELLRLLRRRFLIILACAILVPLAAYLASKSQPKRYSSTATLLFRSDALDEQLLGASIANVGDRAREAATNLRLISLRIIIDRTEQRLPDVGPVGSAVEIVAEGESDLVSVTGTHGNPETASRIANTVAEEYIAFRRESDRETVRQAERLVRSRLAQMPTDERSGPRGRALSDRLEDLALFGSLQTGNTKLIERAQPAAGPSSPRPRRNAAIGGFLGLLLGLALAFAIDRLDRRLRTVEEAERIYGRPAVGFIPHDSQIGIQRSSPGTYEAFSLLRANLRFLNVTHEIRSVFVTSSSSGDGKSTISWNLAMASAAAGTRTLLIEADLRRPTLALNAGVSGRAGLTGVIAGNVDFGDAVHEIPVNTADSDDGPRFDVLFAGDTPPNPTDMLESKQMTDLLRHAEGLYDFVVLDTPPASLVSDAIPLIRQTSGALVVVRLGRTTIDSASRLQGQLSHLGANVLGIVINGAPSDTSYGYGYAYASPAHISTNGLGSGRFAGRLWRRREQRPPGGARRP